MNKISILSFILVLTSLNLSAKKVKFSVDMTGQTINSTGVHIVGDFQSEAGLGVDFAQLSPMTLESGNIYSIVVNIPAFRKYEYKFANGNLFYEVEFVPVESRVGYDGVDNRWIYVDSLKNDTSFVGAILYGGNAPAGLNLVRCLVDMTSETLNANGVHVAGSFQNWSTTKNPLYMFENSVYETIFYVASGSYNYKYYNGNAISNTETVPSSCASSGNRSIPVTKDTVLNVVCYSSCAACLGTSIKEYGLSQTVSLYPNPSSSFSYLVFNDNAPSHQVILCDVTGKTIRDYKTITGQNLTIAKEELNAGIYFIRISSAASTTAVLKLMIN